MPLVGTGPSLLRRLDGTQQLALMQPGETFSWETLTCSLVIGASAHSALGACRIQPSFLMMLNVSIFEHFSQWWCPAFVCILRGWPGSALCLLILVYMIRVPGTVFALNSVIHASVWAAIFWGQFWAICFLLLSLLLWAQLIVFLVVVVVVIVAAIDVVLWAVSRSDSVKADII